MQSEQRERLTDEELCDFFDRLFPNGFAGADVLSELAPDGWERSPLVACFHPSVERVFEERLHMHRNFEELKRAWRRGQAVSEETAPAEDEPTLEIVRQTYQPELVNAQDELTELIGLCLWDVFSDNHDVITADGRVANIGSFRGAGAFLDEYLTRSHDSWREGDYMRFYMGTLGIAGRADLAPVYCLIFRRLEAIGADWVYAFPQLFVVELGAARDEDESATPYSPTESLAAERTAQQRATEVAQLRADLADTNTRAREEAMDLPPPATVRAYREIYGRDPSGWPPV